MDGAPMYEYGSYKAWCGGDFFGNTTVITEPRYGDCYDARARWRGDGVVDIVFFGGICVVVLFTSETCAFLEIFGEYRQF